MEAKVYVSKIGQLKGPLPKIIERTFTKLADQIFNETGEQEFDLVISQRGARGRITVELRTPDVDDSIVISRTIDPERRTIHHELFYMAEEYQGKGLSRHVLNATDKIAKYANVNRVVLDANLDVGGYAWLRKGVFPKDAQTLVEQISGSYELKSEFRALAANMTEQQLRHYVLTEDFRRFKPLFLGCSWVGSVDLDDDISRTAFTKSAAQASAMVDRQIGPPSTANEQVLDKLVRHQTFLMRYAASQTKEARDVMLETEDKVRMITLRYADLLEGLPITSPRAQKLLQQMTQDIAQARDEGWDKIIEKDLKDAPQFAQVEQAATLNALQAPMPVQLGLQPLPSALLRKIARSTPFEGRTLKEWLERTRDVDVQAIVATAKTGIIQGDTPTQLARRVLGTKQLDYKDGQTRRRTFRNLEAVYLTVTNGISNQVKQELYRENKDVIHTELFVATLDFRTTLICASNDGKQYPVNKGPVPPLHFRCRSLRVPYINPDNLGERPFNPATERMLLAEFAEEHGLSTIRARAELPKGNVSAYNKFAQRRKRELIGRVPATQNFQTWLRNQSPQFQDEYLGVRKAKIFRQGKLTLDKFVSRDGYELTLPQLEKLT